MGCAKGDKQAATSLPIIPQVLNDTKPLALNYVHGFLSVGMLPRVPSSWNFSKHSRSGGEKPILSSAEKGSTPVLLSSHPFEVLFVNIRSGSPAFLLLIIPIL